MNFLQKIFSHRLPPPEKPQPLPTIFQQLAAGHQFTVAEILALGNPPHWQQFGSTTLFSHLVARQGGLQAVTLAELLQLGNQPDNAGDCVALILARQGRAFSGAEIELLGNPRDEHGASLAHWVFRLIKMMLPRYNLILLQQE